ncbi:glycolate oxidase subunit GlcF [Amaricoccus solimangrovi]|uniref:Glycolate oxidase iron-sulfur subunit n=1 Tax=Amaricoccus solimangrovi TaxID=2589815 RepID=A0A501WTR0_9RHOB|nr:glycolate oxidase subunit GlcF [Amaricoccus solimangrovi]TPE51504.1 glycolate oxidase subunit GlcF [Amaricoccus solimangrovi]
MRTNFSEEQLADPETAEANGILRTCVHCGFCTATCPTYQVLGDELDSPRGRIYLIKDMLEAGRPADEKTVKHIDRCLSCLSCMTTCPSGVDYMHLVDHARVHIERTYKRPWAERRTRDLLAFLLPHPERFRAALRLARLGRPFAGALPGRLRAMLDLAPAEVPAKGDDGPRVIPAEGERRMRVALLTGCAQRVLDPGINAATIRLLTRHGVEVVIAEGMGCCGALTHHMGREEEARASARENIAAWTREIAGEGLDAIVVNTSGCGTVVKDYGHLFAREPEEAAARVVAERAKDLTEVMTTLGLREPGGAPGLRVAYHAACSLQHGQRVREQPKALLRAAGFEVVEPRDSHLCCGSAGTYNLIQPEIAGKLRDRKVETLAELGPQVIAAGNLGCMTQIASGIDVPVVHTAELLDWATGGPKPRALADRA